MRTVSTTWSALVADGHSRARYKFVIDGTEYSDAAEISHRVSGSIYSQFGIGNASTAQLDLTLLADDIPKGAKIERWVQLVSEDGTVSSDWLPAGVFFTNRRTEADGIWTIEAYDSMRKAEKEWAPDSDLVFPMSMPMAVAEFCRIMGVELDERTVLNSAYSIDYPANGYTIRNVLEYIAAAHGGNWVMTWEGKLRLVPLVPTGDAHQIGLDLIGFSDNGLRPWISRVTLLVDDETVCTAGDDSGLELTAACPYATQNMVETVLAAASGYQYHPYSASAVRLDPAAELGDLVSVGGITSVIAALSDDGSGFPDISAPGEAELEDEYPASGPMTREFNRKINETQSKITKTADEIKLTVQKQFEEQSSALSVALEGISTSVKLNESNITELKQTAGQVNVFVKDVYGTLSTTINAKTWEAIRKNLNGETTSGFYYDFTLGRFVYDGTGVFRSADGTAYIEVENNSLVLYGDSGTGEIIKKLQIGFTPSGGVDYPYIQLGSGGDGNDPGLVKKFMDGVYIGTGAAAKDAAGDFAPQAGYAGIFVNTIEGRTYVIDGDTMKDIYTGDAIARFG